MIERVVSWAIFAVIAAAVLFVGYCGLRCVMATGEDAFCYTQVYSPPGMAPQYALMAFRDWRENRQIGIYGTVDEAKRVADSIGCRMGHR